MVLCGSVSSWIDKKILKSKGFVGRPSLNLLVPELSMRECAAFWRRGGCKASTTDQARRMQYVIEIKRRDSIGEWVVSEVEEKLSKFNTARSVSVVPVLVYDGNLSKRVQADGYFGWIVSANELLGR